LKRCTLLSDRVGGRVGEGENLHVLDLDANVVAVHGLAFGLDAHRLPQHEAAFVE
jgi:hypothetical protein